MTEIPPCREVLSGNSCFKQTPNSLETITILLHLFPHLCSVRVQSKSHLGESLEVFLLISVDVRTGFYLGTLRFQPNHVLGIITGSSARQNIPLSSACAKLISVFSFFFPALNKCLNSNSALLRAEDYHHLSEMLFDCLGLVMGTYRIIPRP